MSPEVRVLSSNFGEFSPNHSRDTYQICSGSPGCRDVSHSSLLHPHTQLQENLLGKSVPGLRCTAKLPAPGATVATTQGTLSECQALYRHCPPPPSPAQRTVVEEYERLAQGHSKQQWQDQSFLIRAAL